ncbi:hypothetical protein PV08_00078 [Exophiala spinifera]|uniref:2'-5' RNA ligase family protein n=1 Tax=Exophiala spinifera TaxID=91928 RepID=A0A0D1YW89_9EURO|nr:uncharacterized protein PV08_00078 [Exophiala spinifera]KIW19506.1 hypothetical protein PV08_00078 [Exophiala spinifera]
MPVVVNTIPFNAPYSKPSGPYTAETYQRRAEHKARTGNKHEESYVLTLHTDRQHHQSMTSLRKRYFPPRLNKLDAHIALFRALPGSRLPQIIDDIKALVQSQAPFEVYATRPFLMKHGVGIHVDDPDGQAETIFKHLKAQWEPFLSQQDRSFRAHYTLQNKVDDDAVIRQTFKEVNEQFHGNRGQVIALTLYKYERGFWNEPQYFYLNDTPSDDAGGESLGE